MAEIPDYLNGEYDEFIETVINHLQTIEVLYKSWYKITDHKGRSTLHIAILMKSFSLFDKLIELPDFPLQMKDNEGNTPLETALLKPLYSSNDTNRDLPEHFALELIKKGVDIDHPLLLHCAVKLNFLQVIKLLLDKGYAVNERDDKGNTPLHICFYHHKNVEVMLMLLFHGANPFLPDCCDDIPFVSSLAMLAGCKDSTNRSYYNDVYNLCETLFDYTFDKHGQYKISVYAFQLACQLQLPFTERIIDQFIDQISIFYNDKIYGFYLSDLLHLNCKYINVLIKRFPEAVKKMFSTDNTEPVRRCDAYAKPFWKAPICKIFNKFIESEAQSQMITYISKLSTMELICDLKLSEACLTEVICYLLSYGLCLDDYTLKWIYIEFGYCELFKICLHMDVEIESYIEHIMVRLITDVSVDIQEYIDNVDNCLEHNDDDGFEELLRHCAHPKLKQYCYSLDDKEITRKVDKLPTVPLLTELSRNVFRKHFIQRMGVQSMSQFYDKLNLLPISSVLKKVVSYEVPLYP